MSKHAPGPWRMGGGNCIKVLSDTGEYITQRDTRNMSMARADRVRADCRLIAAAPELLEALIAAENALADYVPTLEAKGASLNYGHSVIKQARAAIAKATS